MRKRRVVDDTNYGTWFTFGLLVLIIIILSSVSLDRVWGIFDASNKNDNFVFQEIVIDGLGGSKTVFKYEENLTEEQINELIYLVIEEEKTTQQEFDILLEKIK